MTDTRGLKGRKSRMAYIDICTDILRLSSLRGSLLSYNLLVLSLSLNFSVLSCYYVVIIIVNCVKNETQSQQ